MQAVLTGFLPQRAELEGAFRAGIGGIGSPLCKTCPAPEYTYVAKAKKLQGVVIAQVRVRTNGIGGECQDRPDSEPSAFRRCCPIRAQLEFQGSSQCPRSRFRQSSMLP